MKHFHLFFLIKYKQCWCFLVRLARVLWLTGRIGSERKAVTGYSHLFDYNLAVPVNGAVIDHADNRDSEVTADSERYAEAEAAHDGDDVATREPETRTVAQRRFLLLHLRGPSIFSQLDNLTRFLLLLHHPVKTDNIAQFREKKSTFRFLFC